MTKADLVRQVAKRTGLKEEEAKLAVEAFFAGIKEGILNLETVRIVNFGKFFVKKTNARRGRNPKIGTEINLEPRYLARFKMGRQLKQQLVAASSMSQTPQQEYSQGG